MPEIVSKEARFIIHIPASPQNEDTHMVKELLHLSDGTTKKNIRYIKNFCRPFWVTKEHYRNHKQKKESEDIDHLLEGKATESHLGREIAIRLGSQYNCVTDLYTVKRSPYLYGVDVNSRTYIKYLYQQKYKNVSTPYEIAILDIEADIMTNELTIISIAMRDKIYTVATRQYLEKKIVSSDKHTFKKEVIKKLEYLYDKYIPKTKLSESVSREYDVGDTEIDVVKLIMKRLHEWSPDIVAGWNVDYDISKILELIESNHIDPKDIMCDPNMPRELRRFSYKQGRLKTAKGGAINPEQRWHVVTSTSSFYWIDAMATHYYIRVGGHSIPGGYSLDNILKSELGKSLGKLKFKDVVAEHLKGVEWHKYMTVNKPLEYITYNQWDVLSLLEMDDKTKDLCVVMPMLSGVSNFDIFNSGPKRIIDALHFYYLSRGKVLGVKDPRAEDNNLLGLSDWILLMPSYRISDNGKDILMEGGDKTNIRTHCFDADQCSGYPSNTQAANVSRDTTVRELAGIEGMTIDDFRTNNINLLFGKVNAISYGSEMFNLPNLFELMNTEY